MKTIIQLSGLKRSGKDHTATLLKEIYEEQGYSVEIMSYAAPMKRIISTIFGISLEELDKYKNSSDQFKINVIDMVDGGHSESTDFRTILQLFGNEAMKTEFGDNVWGELMSQNIAQSKADIIIIPDCRFNIEIKTVGGLIVRVVNSGIKCDSTHSSETELDDYTFDYYLDNTGHALTKEKLRPMASLFLDKGAK